MGEVSQQSKGYFNVERAIEYYYEREDISNEEIANIFSCARRGSIMNEKKKQAMARMKEEGRMPYKKGMIVTECAYRAWGIDVEALEKKMARHKKYLEIKVGIKNVQRT